MIEASVLGYGTDFIRARHSHIDLDFYMFLLIQWQCVRRKRRSFMENKSSLTPRFVLLRKTVEGFLQRQLSVMFTNNASMPALTHRRSELLSFVRSCERKLKCRGPSWNISTGVLQRGCSERRCFGFHGDKVSFDKAAASPLRQTQYGRHHG